MKGMTTTRWLLLTALATLAGAAVLWATTHTGNSEGGPRGSSGEAGRARPGVAAAAPGAGLAAAEAGQHPTDHLTHDHATAPLTPLEIRDLGSRASDPRTAGEAVVHIRQHLQGDLPPQYQALMKRLLVRGLITSRGPLDEIMVETDALAAELPQEGGIRVLFYVETAQALLRPGGKPQEAVRYARQALNDIPIGEADPTLTAFVKDLLGRAHLANGDCEAAGRNLLQASAVHPDSGRVLYSLGAAYEQCGKNELAIDTYVRSLGAFYGTDSSAAEPLRNLYASTHGSLKGLDRRLKAARDASVQREVFEARRYERAAPAWTMEDTDGKRISLSDFAGKIVVLDFWGSWCGPCRQELPHFQAMYEKYKDEGVVFYGVNWERAPRDQRKLLAMDYLARNTFDFPSVFDLDDKASVDYQVRSFPTVFLIDGKGKIRYRNQGFNEAISRILELQIESLLAETDA